MKQIHGIYIASGARHHHKGTVQAIQWNPNGDTLATASRDQTIRVFDIRAMKELQLFKGHKKDVCCTLRHLIPQGLMLTLSCLSDCLAPCSSRSFGFWRGGRLYHILDCGIFHASRHNRAGSRLECVGAGLASSGVHYLFWLE